MVGATGRFVTRAFEAMLKECAAYRGKFTALQLSIQSYLGACMRPLSSLSSRALGSRGG
jgi:guanine nucleotide-exchange factor